MTEYIRRIEHQVWCYWGVRAATPRKLAPRFLDTIDQLRRVDPLLDGWVWSNVEESFESEGEYGRTPLIEVRPWMVEAIEENMRREDDTTDPDPSLGYAMPVSIETKPDGPFTSVAVYDGDSWPCKSFAANSAEFSITDDNYKENPLVSFPTFKAAMLILAETWEATWAKAFPNDMVQKTDWDGMKPGWG
ncbi:MAG: hypothetical protein P4L76_04160, partial [Beijerinckiaceae bacterium]|nr:hypothetical protein [Beijerinckiaceae bacterium]